MFSMTDGAVFQVVTVALRSVVLVISRFFLPDNVTFSGHELISLVFSWPLHHFLELR